MQSRWEGIGFEEMNSGASLFPKAAVGPQRLAALDALRGLCALLVALHHFKANGVVANNVFIENAYLFVDFFFVLSGYIIAMKYRVLLSGSLSVRIYLTKRFARLYPLFIATLIPFILVEIFVIPQYPSWREPFIFPVDLRSLVLTVLMLNSVGLTEGLTWNYPSWSIGAEMMTYIWFAALVVLAKRQLVWVLVGVALISLGAVMLLSTRFIEVTHELGAVRCAAGFALGALLWEVTSREERNHATSSFAAWTAWEATALLTVVAFVVLAGRNVGSFAAPFVFAFVVLPFAQERGAISRILSRRPFLLLGTWSYSIYLVHSFWASRIFSGGLKIADSHGLNIIDHSNGRFGITGMEGNFLSLIYVTAVILTAASSYRLVEKPGRLLIMRLFGPREPRKIAAPAERG